MCGIFGWYTSKPKSDNMYIYNMLGIENQWKGSDSVGLVGFDKDNNKKEIKKLTEFDLLMKDISEGKVDFKFRDQHVVISHVRKASKGLISDQNIHPFTSGHICLAHNGTIDNFDALKAATKQDWDCDSKHLAYLIEHNGNTLPARGPETLVWYNTKDNMMNIIKFERGIDVYFNKYIAFFSSDSTILDKINKYFFFKNLTKVDPMIDRTHLKITTVDDKIQVVKGTCDWVNYAEPKKYTYPTSHSNFNQGGSSKTSTSFSLDDNPYYNKKRKKGMPVK